MNSFPTWNDAYSVGNELLDEQHKRLLDIGGKAFRLLATPYVPPPNFDSLLREYADAQLPLVRFTALSNHIPMPLSAPFR